MGGCIGCLILVLLAQCWLSRTRSATSGFPEVGDVSGRYLAATARTRAIWTYVLQLSGSEAQQRLFTELGASMTGSGRGHGYGATCRQH